MHDVASMGWKMGDRIAISPTTIWSQGYAQWFIIGAIDGTHIHLAADSTLNTPGILNQVNI